MPPVTTVTCKFGNTLLIFNVYSSLNEVESIAKQRLEFLVKNPDDWEITY